MKFYKLDSFLCIEIHFQTFQQKVARIFAHTHADLPIEDQVFEKGPKGESWWQDNYSDPVTQHAKTQSISLSVYKETCIKVLHICNFINTKLICRPNSLPTIFC